MNRTGRTTTTLLTIFMAIALLVSNALASGDEARARRLINSQGCKGCHQIEGNGGTLGPSLDGVGSRLKPEQLRTQLIDPRKLNADSMMPSFSHLDKDDLDALIEYLASLKQ